MKKVSNALLMVIITIACLYVVVYADSPDTEALEAEQKYHKAERVYRKRLEEKERERVVKQREMKHEQCEHCEENGREERTPE
ncbi:MAG: hypothetical protein PVH46_09765 [Granulosicoccaceae bacterium]|jgi:hypothetical protein